MPIINRIADFAAEMTAWRQDFHRHPELGFQEHRTSDIVAAKLAEWGIEVTRGIATTGETPEEMVTVYNVPPAMLSELAHSRMDEALRTASRLSAVRASRRTPVRRVRGGRLKGRHRVPSPVA